MPAIGFDDAVFGVTIAFVVFWGVNAMIKPRRMPLWGAAILAGVASLGAGYILPFLGKAVESIPILSDITSGAGKLFSILKLHESFHDLDGKYNNVVDTYLSKSSCRFFNLISSVRSHQMARQLSSMEQTVGFFH